MFCPQCGSTQNDELKYCKMCGSNLQALRQVMSKRETDDEFDWSKTWVAEMFMTRDEIDKVKNLTPEMKRQREIKGGVITASVGIGLMVFLFVFMGGVIATGVSAAAAEVLSRLWIVGVIPLLVGAALIFNGVFVSKRGAETTAIDNDAVTKELEAPAELNYLSPADTTDIVTGVPFSVTDPTTRHLQKKERSRDK
jgi:hypothetical protein